MKILQHLLPSQLATAAADLGCALPMIMAVAEVESPAGPFLADGRPTILFERHWFHKLTGGRFSKSHPALSNSKAGGYGAGGAAQWVRLAKARDLCKAAGLPEDAALMSASWGMFQILGVNHKGAGFETVQEFCTAIHLAPIEHLKAFVAFVKSKGLEGQLRRRDFDGFAAVYNGPGYRKNRYDDKMADAFVRATEWLNAQKKKPGVAPG